MKESFIVISKPSYQCLRQFDITILFDRFEIKGRYWQFLKVIESVQLWSPNNFMKYWLKAISIFEYKFCTWFELIMRKMAYPYISFERFVYNLNIEFLNSLFLRRLFVFMVAWWPDVLTRHSNCAFWAWKCYRYFFVFIMSYKWTLRKNWMVKIVVKIYFN